MEGVFLTTRPIFPPGRFLYNAPPDLYWGVMIPLIVVYVVGWYLGMALMKLSQSPFLQVVAMLMLGCYFAVFYIAGALGQKVRRLRRRAKEAQGANSTKR